MKVLLSILVNLDDIDFSGSVIEKDDVEGATFYDIDLEATYNGLEIDDMDYDTAEDYLIDQVKEGAIEAGRPIPYKVVL